MISCQITNYLKSLNLSEMEFTLVVLFCKLILGYTESCVTKDCNYAYWLSKMLYRYVQKLFFFFYKYVQKHFNVSYKQLWCSLSLENLIFYGIGCSFYSKCWCSRMGWWHPSSWGISYWEVSKFQQVQAFSVNFGIWDLYILKKKWDLYMVLSLALIN